MSLRPNEVILGSRFTSCSKKYKGDNFELATSSNKRRKSERSEASGVGARGLPTTTTSNGYDASN